MKGAERTTRKANIKVNCTAMKQFSWKEVSEYQMSGTSERIYKLQKLNMNNMSA